MVSPRPSYLIFPGKEAHQNPEGIILKLTKQMDRSSTRGGPRWRLRRAAWDPPLRTGAALPDVSTSPSHAPFLVDMGVMKSGQLPG